MRRMIDFICSSDRLSGTLDDAAGTTGLLIVSGGNEIRSGAYAGQAAMAAHFAAMGYPVFRYDRRGVGESEGVNRDFESTADDIAAAATAFRTQAPHIRQLVAFGNCDAATALALFHANIAVDALILANPWTIETLNSDDILATANTASIRARYWARIKNPRSLLDLLTGRIDLRKLANGLAKASAKAQPSGLATRLAQALTETSVAADILIAARDTTALAFMAEWKGSAFDSVRTAANVRLTSVDTASHSFADAASGHWLLSQIENCLKRADGACN